MSQQNEVRHSENCQITAKTTVSTANGKVKKVPLRKRKEDAKQTLYLNRV